jgi:hypothetical protein
MDKACLEIRDLIALGEEVSGNERIAVESHVSICVDCAREMAETRSLLGSLSVLREGEMPPGAAERIWRGVQSAVPGRRRALALQWSVRAAAVLVMGLAIGYTTKSVMGRPVESGVAEDSRLDVQLPTFVPTRVMAPRPSTDERVTDPAPVPQIAPRAWSLHHLPYVDEILEQDVVRF